MGRGSRKKKGARASGHAPKIVGGDCELGNFVRGIAGGLDSCALASRALLHEIDELVEFEIHNGDFFADVSEATLSRIYASIQGLLDHTLRITERDPSAACEHVLCGNERWIEEIDDLAEELAMLGQRHSKNEEIVDQCEHIEILADKMRAETIALLEAREPAGM